MTEEPLPTKKISLHCRTTRTALTSRFAGLLALLLIWCAAPSVSAQDQAGSNRTEQTEIIKFSGPAVWVALVKADKQGKTTDPRLLELQPHLDPIFGYPAYHIVKEDWVPLVQKWEHWVIPRDDYYMKVYPFEDLPNGATRVQFELYNGKKFLTQQRYDFKDDFARPLLINGPAYKDGHLHYIIKLVPEAPAAYIQEKRALYRSQGKETE